MPISFSLAASLSLLLPGQLSARDLPDYKVGDTATQAIVTPVPLVVIDQEQTAALKEKEAAKVLVICRYYTNTADVAESEFRAASASTRSNFLAKVEAAFGKPKLEAEEIAGAKFLRLMAVFQKQNKVFPLSTNLAAAWAAGEPDETLLSPLVAVLRNFAQRPLRPYALAADLKFGRSVRLVPLARPGEPLSLDQAERFSEIVPATNVLIFPRAQETLIEGFSAEDRPTARFLSGLLKPNCVPDGDLTGQARAKQVASLMSATRYEAGQTIVRQGQVIDRQAKAALDTLRSKTSVAELPPKASGGQRTPEPAAVPNQWVLAAIAAVFGMLAAAVWRMTRRRRAASLLPARVAGGSDPAVLSYQAGAENTLVAEDEREPTDFRGQVAAQLARLLMKRLAQGFNLQRSNLADGQKKAAEEVAELEARLQKIHAPLQERLRAYEQRISELEKELDRKGEENRELIKIKIALVRHQLATAKDEVGLN